jgi:putative DNA methylase
VRQQVAIRQRKTNKPKAEQVLDLISELVDAGSAQRLEGLDFSDPARPKSCLEVDFPILPINEVAVIENAADKPIYQVSKYWARRSSSVFRAMLIAAATKAPSAERQASATVWKSFYGNHQGNPDFSKLKVADIFMGGGTTLVEAARLGMEVVGNDLNPMSWFVVKSELARTTKDEVQRLLADVDEKVGSAIRPYYAGRCPKGHEGRWVSKLTGSAVKAGFDPLAIPFSERERYSYTGPELIYTFWAKHGPCQAAGCGHRTPLMSTPIFAVKTMIVRAWLDRVCSACQSEFDIEQRPARMAPSEPYVIVNQEKPHAIMDDEGNYSCPKCTHTMVDHAARVLGESSTLGKSENKKVYLHLMVDPAWLKGSGATNVRGEALGGSATDPADANVRWYLERSQTIAFIEIRGESVPETIVHPTTGQTLFTTIGTSEMKQTDNGMHAKKSSFACKAATCGRGSDVLDAVRASGKTGPMSPFAYHMYCRECDTSGEPYSGRWFVPARDVSSIVASELEWASRKSTDLAGYWPTDPLSDGWKTHKWGIPDHGYTHYWKMFNARQLLGLAQLLKTIVHSDSGSWDAKEALLGAFQQYIRNQNLLCFWNESADKMEPHFSGNNYSLKSRPIENNFYGKIGRGNWRACAEGAIEALEWREVPWERVTKTEVQRKAKDIAKEMTSGKSVKVMTGDAVLDRISFTCGSSTDLHRLGAESIDMVITDPPFSELVQYSELSDFFYVWLAPILRARYPEIFAGPFTPKTLEAVENPYRQGKDAKAFYQRILTECWREAYRILKPGGILAFTFHHSEDGPWVQVLESLFSAGFYLEATYPIRGDESKGDSQFGSMKVEYDIIHVCRRRIEEPELISWARLRRKITDDIQQIKDLLEQHEEYGLPKADLEVIKRGKALEYFSKHFGKVYVERGREFTLPEALSGIRQLIDDSEGGIAPPVLAEPYTRQFLRIFDQVAIVPRDQMMKFLRGTGTDSDVFEKLGWCREEKKSFHHVSPLEFAQAWKGKPRKGMSGDLDQALFLIGACYPDSGIRVDETLNNQNFVPHPAVADLLDWLGGRGGLAEMRRASQIAKQLFAKWIAEHKAKADAGKQQFDLFLEGA